MQSAGGEPRHLPRPALFDTQGRRLQWDIYRCFACLVCPIYQRGTQRHMLHASSILCNHQHLPRSRCHHRCLCKYALCSPWHWNFPMSTVAMTANSPTCLTCLALRSPAAPCSPSRSLAQLFDSSAPGHCSSLVWRPMVE